MSANTDDRTDALPTTDGEAETMYAIINEQPLPLTQQSALTIVNKLAVGKPDDPEAPEPEAFARDTDKNVETYIGSAHAVYRDPDVAKYHFACYRADGQHNHLSLVRLDTKTVAEDELE